MKINSTKVFIGILLAFLLCHVSIWTQGQSLLKEMKPELTNKTDFTGWQNPLSDPLKFQATVYNPFLQKNVESTSGKMALDYIEFEAHYEIVSTQHFTYDVKGRCTSHTDGEFIETWEYDDENLSYIHISPIYGTTIYKFNQAGKIIELEIFRKGSYKTIYHYDSLLNLIETNYSTYDSSGSFKFGQNDYYTYQNGDYITTHSIFTKSSSNQEYKLYKRIEYSYSPSNRPLSIIELIGIQTGMVDTIQTKKWEYISFNANQNDSMITYKFKNFTNPYLDSTVTTIFNSIGNQIERHKFSYNSTNHTWFEKSKSLRVYDSLNLLTFQYDFTRTMQDTTWAKTKSQYSYDSLYQINEVLIYELNDTIWAAVTKKTLSYVSSPPFTNITIYSFHNGYNTFEQKLLDNGFAHVSYYSDDIWSGTGYNTAYRNEDVILPPSYTHPEIGYMLTGSYETYIQYGGGHSFSHNYHYSPISLMGQLEKKNCPILKTYPNPATTLLTVETSEDEAATLELFNNQGQMLGSFPIIQKATIPVAQLAKGIYFLRMVNKGVGLGTSKFIKE